MDRRQLIQAAAAGVVLPNFVEAASTPVKRDKLQKRLVLVSVKFGLFGRHHQEGGADSRYARTFKDFKGEMTYFRGLGQPGVSGGHQCQKSTFTAFKYEDRNMYPGQKMFSLDQRIAEQTIQETRHKSIIHDIIGYGEYMGWNQFSQPIKPIYRANKLHHQLFGRIDTDLQKKILKRDRDILLALSRNMRRLGKGRPGEKQMHASVEYRLEEIEEKEKWLKKGRVYSKREFSERDEKTPLLTCKNNFDTILEAFEKDQCRIANLSFGEAGICSGVDGIENHHSFTHHGGMVNRIKGLEKIDTLVLKGVRGFLEGLKEKNLYDDTVVLFHCGMADAMKHSNRDTPTYLFGGGFNHKTQIECMNGDEQKYSIASLFASVMKQCGVRKPDFNGTTKVIPELFTGA